MVASARCSPAEPTAGGSRPAAREAGAPVPWRAPEQKATLAMESMALSPPRAGALVLLSPVPDHLVSALLNSSSENKRMRCREQEHEE